MDEGAAMPNASQKKYHWQRGPRPLGLLVVWAGRVAAFLLRGCWHTDLGWPVREGDHSYQVCLRCGIKRLFDENAFHGYGPYGYDVNELIARERADRSDEPEHAGALHSQLHQGEAGGPGCGAGENRPGTGAPTGAGAMCIGSEMAGKSCAMMDLPRRVGA